MTAAIVIAFLIVIVNDPDSPGLPLHIQLHRNINLELSGWVGGVLFTVHTPFGNIISLFIQ